MSDAPANFDEALAEAHPCHTCGKPTPIHLLDAKPAPGKWNRERLRRAADAGVDFKHLECEACYGPHWIEGSQP